MEREGGRGERERERESVCGVLVVLSGSFIS